MTKEYLDKLYELMQELDELATKRLLKSNYTEDTILLTKIKYLIGYIESLKQKP